jgi:outer membrane protein W
MKAVLRLLPLLLLLFTSPLLAQSNALTLFVTSQHNGGGSRFPDPTRDLRIEFDTGSGAGVAFDHAFGRRYSAEVALFHTTSHASIRQAGVGSQRVGDIELTPVTIMARAHSRSGGTFGLYAGAGLAYVMAGDLRNPDAGTVPIGNKTTFAVGGGAIWNFGRRAGIVLDARYLPLKLEGHVTSETIDAKIDPLLLSLGLRIRF